MNFYETQDFYVLSKEQSSLWCSRNNGDIQVRPGLRIFITNKSILLMLIMLKKCLFLLMFDNNKALTGIIVCIFDEKLIIFNILASSIGDLAQPTLLGCVFGIVGKIKFFPGLNDRLFIH